MNLSTSLDLSKAKTSLPMIVNDHQCRCRFVNCKAKANDKGEMLSFEYHLLDPAPNTDGGQVQPGFPLFENITLYDKNTPAGEVPQRSITTLCKRIDGFLGTGDEGNKKAKPSRPNLTGETTEQTAAKLTEALLGKEAIIKVKVKTGDFEGNEISSVTFPGDLQA